MTDQSEHLIIDGVRIPAVMDRGNLWFMGKATDKATFKSLALVAGLHIYTNPAQAEILNPETGEVLFPAVEASGRVIVAPDILVRELGPLTLVQATYGDDGVELTAAVIDPDYHVNWWLGPKAIARGNWMPWVTLWTYSGATMVSNNVEDGTVMRGMAIIDPATVNSPSNRLL
jgi:hypothetical protein